MYTKKHRVMGKLTSIEQNYKPHFIVGILLFLLVFFVFKFYAELLPFISGVVLAYLLAPLANFFKRITRCNTISVLSSLFIGICVILLFLSVVIPLLLQQLQIVYKSVALINLNVVDRIFDHFAFFDNLPEYLKTAFKNSISEIARYISAAISAFFESFVSYTSHIAIETILILAIAPFTAFYLLRDSSSLKTKLVDLIPSKYKSSILNIAGIIDNVFVSFIRGQLLVSGVLTIYFILCFFIFGFRAYIGIGLIMGFFSLIPYAGSFIIFILSFLLALLELSLPVSLVVVLVVGGISQLLDIMILRPKLIGNRLGLHPVFTVLSIIIAGSLFGFVGMFLAIPLTVLLMMVIKFVVRKYRTLIV